jgi:hypothetical protein
MNGIDLLYLKMHPAFSFCREESQWESWNVIRDMRMSGSSLPDGGTIDEPDTFVGQPLPHAIHAAAPEGRPGGGFSDWIGIPGNNSNSVSPHTTAGRRISRLSQAPPGLV